MRIHKKKFRYYYWLVIAFIQKHLKLILLSFLISFVFIIGIISFSPYIENIFLNRQDVIGIVGNIDFNSMPDEITSKISNGLLFINEKGDYIPAIASTWESLKNGQEYRFHLRDGLIWSDGKKFTAYDLNFQFKDVKIKIIDDKTIYFNLTKPLPIFPTYLSTPIIRYPLIGIAGLYNVDRIKTKYGYITELSLSPNKKNLPIVIYKFYPNESQMINAYKKGEINQMKINKKSLTDIFQTWKNTVIIKNVDYTKLLTLFFNFNNKLLKEKDVRQAIGMSIDNLIFKDLGEIARGPISPTSWAFNPNLKQQFFDPQSGEKILKKYLDSSDSGKLNFYTYYDYLSDAENITKELNNVGLTVNLNLLSSEKPGDFDLFLAFWNVPKDPDQYFFWHSTQSQGNLGNYNNVKIDKLLEDGRNLSSVSDRKKIYFDFQKVIQDDPPGLFLYYPYVYTIKRK